MEMRKELGSPDMSRIANYEAAKPYLTCRLINAQKVPADRPHKSFCEDLAVTYHVVLGEDDRGTASTPVTNMMMEGFHVSPDQLHEDAVKGMKRMTPSTYNTMGNVLMDLFNTDVSPIPPGDDDVMYVLSNTTRFAGAAALLDEELMSEITDKHKLGFVMLPSSIHEVLILPQKEDMPFDFEGLNEMVREVNAHEVVPEEQLADHAYWYDPETRQFTNAERKELAASA